MIYWHWANAGFLSLIGREPSDSLSNNINKILLWHLRMVVYTYRCHDKFLCVFLFHIWVQRSANYPYSKPRSSCHYFVNKYKQIKYKNNKLVKKNYSFDLLTLGRDMPIITYRINAWQLDLHHMRCPWPWISNVNDYDLLFLSSTTLCDYH